MTVLLDTHVLLWALSAPERIPERERGVLEDGANRVLYSAASVWEIAIKQGLGRVRFDFDAAAIALEAQRVGFSELPVFAEAAAGVAKLPAHHRDPFDRLLVAQALSEPARLLTADPALVPYTELVWLFPA
jgi:PIN domain nuclease of toxin-antitoxin system